MDNKIIDKLQKLLAHAESAKECGNMDEAAAFAGKVQDLLTKHQLSMSDIEIAEEKASGEQVERELVSPERLGVKFSSKVQHWQVDLLNGLAAANNCQSFYGSGSNYQKIVGLQADRLQTIALFRYFAGLAQVLCEKAAKEHKKSLEYTLHAEQAAWNDWNDQGGKGEMAAYMRTWRTSWLTGFARTIGERSKAAKRQAVREVEDTAVASNALVHLRNKEAMVSDYVKNQMKVTTGKGSQAGYNGSAYRAGREAGSSVALTSNTLAS